MPSPFPGMDPFLEPYWSDIHLSLISYIRDALQRVLPGDLVARTEERVVLEYDDHLQTRFADVSVSDQVRSAGSDYTVESESPTTPTVIELPERSEDHTEGFIEIRELKGNRKLITVIEVLSPSNKNPGTNREAYVAKRDELMYTGVNFVEIDLLRRGEWTVMVRQDSVAPAQRAPYRICVFRAVNWKSAEFYHAPLQSRLPSISVPLRKTDRDIVLELQSLVDRCYEMGRYDTIDYAGELASTLNEADAAWIKERSGRF